MSVPNAGALTSPKPIQQKKRKVEKTESTKRLPLDHRPDLSNP